ncbi:MAG: hypothetical protein CSA01_00235 [Bacteroidetes bacterium]|nr:MAG: hypothetical protein CSA01_00235 [Bacteroidota bacterium]
MNGMMLKKGLMLLFVIGFIQVVNAQDFYRLKADFVIKIKDYEGQLNLTKGQIFYDKNYKELIYDIDFPQKEKWVIKDTLIYRFDEDKKLVGKSGIPAINEFTIFHLALNANLKDFGLGNSIYRIVKVEKQGDLVLSYWSIPDHNIETLDHIILAKKNNRLESVVVMGDGQKILNQQFFRDYKTDKGFEFPHQVVQILYNDNQQKSYQVTEFKNIVVNDMQNDTKYHYKTSAL